MTLEYLNWKNLTFLQLLLFVSPQPAIGSSDHLQKKKSPTCVHKGMRFFKLVKMAIEFVSIFSGNSSFQRRDLFSYEWFYLYPILPPGQSSTSFSLSSHNGSNKVNWKHYNWVMAGESGQLNTNPHSCRLILEATWGLWLHVALSFLFLSFSFAAHKAPSNHKPKKKNRSVISHHFKIAHEMWSLSLTKGLTMGLFEPSDSRNAHHVSNQA